MHIKDLEFIYPDELVALEPSYPHRVMLVERGEPKELSWSELLSLIPQGDLLVINDTEVVKRRVFAETGEEILFLCRGVETQRAWETKWDGLEGCQHSALSLQAGSLCGSGLLTANTSEAEVGASKLWQVLFTARKLKLGDRLQLPDGVEMCLLEKGLPQLVGLNRPIGEAYFDRYGELPLPPYIQKARKLRHNRPDDARWYQTAWARQKGSYAAPTASLHFSSEDLKLLKTKGVEVATLTLHVGLGTFLPVRSEQLKDHDMHSEEVSISAHTLHTIKQVRARGGRVWALGTTVVRALEAWARGHFQEQVGGGVGGETALLLQPGESFYIVDRLMTNFHQPCSTLLALVTAFAGLKEVHQSYAWAVEHRFRLFSYGDLSVWIPK
jgi:S-adenosylmethionine:tRNA ribosyltransferase-isomerase